MKTCDCISEPPHFDLPPPPDPSLIWHLISDEVYEPAEQCSSNQFVSISDIGTFYSETDGEDANHQQLAANILIGIAAISVILLIVVCIAVIGRVRRRRRESLENSKKMSSDSILVAGEHLWHYNSMKQPHNANSSVLMYSNNSNAGSRLFHHTPTTLRSYIGTGTPIMAPNVPVRHSESTTLRMNPNDTCSAYHTVSVSRQQPSSDVYEEIEPIGTLGHVGYLTTRHQNAINLPNAPNMLQTHNGRMSIRRPPPSCRPPQPPQSPACSDESYDKEITRITNSTNDSGSPRQWDDGIESSRSNDGGRESGYGTAPSMQWKSPSESADRSPYVVAQAPNPHSMTYV